MEMPKLTITYGFVLILIGLLAYFVWGDQQSITALIPAFAGTLFVVLGAIANKGIARMHIMHFTVLLALVLIFGTAKSFPKAIDAFNGVEMERPLAVKVQALTAAVSLLYMVLAIKSFIRARLNRNAGKSE